MTSVPLSVVVAVRSGEPLAPECLRSLVAEAGRSPHGLEIVLVDGRGPDAAADHLEGVRRVPAGVELTLPELLGRGIAEAGGEWIALTDGSASFAPGWAKRCRELAAASGADAIGGAVEPAEGLGPADTASFLCDYAPFLAPLAAGPTADQPGCNVVFRRAALAGGEGRPPAAFWKTFHCRGLAARGATLLADGRLLAVSHRRAPAAAALRRRWHHARCYGAMHARNLPAGQRLLLAAAAPILPLVLLARIIGHLRRKGRLERRFLAALPLCAAHCAAWAAGEWAGNLFAAGASCARV